MSTTLFVPKQFPTIRDAVQSANHADTIFIANGFYEEIFKIDKNIHIIGSKNSQ